MSVDMIISPDRLRQIISEEIKRDSLIGQVRLKSKAIIEATSRTSVNISGTKTIKFGVLMEHLDRKIITEAEAFNLWERSINHQIDNMISEGIMDTLKDAYETVKGGAIKLKDKISSAAMAAMEKVNDFLLKAALQAISLAQTSVQGIVSAASKLSGAVSRFKESHPILFKIIMVLIIMLIVFGIMTLFSSDAHASVMVPGKGGKGSQEMSQKSYEALRGALDNYGKQTGSIDKMLDVGDAIKVLDKAFKSKDQIDISALGKFNQAGYNLVRDTVADAKGGDSSAWELLKQWTRIGETLRIR